MMTTLQLVFIGAIAAVAFVIGVGLGSVLNIATGIPMLGGLLNAVATAAVLTIGVCGVKKFGAGTLLWLVLGAMCIPTFTMGPPGVHKILIGLIAGVLWDTCLWLTKYKTIGYYIGGIVMMMAVMFGVIGAAVYFGFPEGERLIETMVYIVPANAVLGSIGVWLGLRIYSKSLKQLAIVKRLEAN